MKSIKVFVVTYDNDELLNKSLDVLLSSDLLSFSYSITVLNNYGILTLPEKYSNVTVLNNSCRPDFSSGHLSRNWNQTLLLGFESLATPACDIVVTLQNDVQLRSEWAQKLVAAHETYSFITQGTGDSLVSYTPAAVKAIGIWDERFCGIGYQEADYFLRAVLYNTSESSVNDPNHGRVHNPLKLDIIQDNTTGFARREKYYPAALEHNCVSLAYFFHKWPQYTTEHFNVEKILESNAKPAALNYMLYPYFEQYLDDLLGKGYAYLVDKSILPKFWSSEEWNS